MTTQTAPFRRNVLVGRTPDSQGIARDFWLEIEFNGSGLSLYGVHGPKSNGDAYGNAGQCSDTLLAMAVGPAPATFTEAFTEYARTLGLTPPTLAAKVAAAWGEWHLNDLQAGSPAQTAHLKAVEGKFDGYPVSFYEWACETLAAAGLHPDPETGYRYGSAWLKVEVPEDVLTLLAGMPHHDFHPWTSKR